MLDVEGDVSVIVALRDGFGGARDYQVFLRNGEAPVVAAVISEVETWRFFAAGALDEEREEARPRQARF